MKKGSPEELPSALTVTAVGSVMDALIGAGLADCSICKIETM